MSPETKSKVLGSIAKAWIDDPEVESVCLAILEFLEAPPKKQYLTYAALKKAAGLKPSESQRQFAAAIQYLMGDAAPVLQIGFEIIDADGTPVRISGDEAVSAAKEQINPLTGEYQHNVGNLIITYFHPSGIMDD